MMVLLKNWFWSCSTIKKKQDGNGIEENGQVVVVVHSPHLSQFANDEARRIGNNKLTHPDTELPFLDK